MLRVNDLAAVAAFNQSSEFLLSFNERGLLQIGRGQPMDDLYAINSAKTEFREAFNSGNPERLIALLDPAFVYMPDGVRLVRLGTRATTIITPYICGWNVQWSLCDGRKRDKKRARRRVADRISA